MPTQDQYSTAILKASKANLNSVLGLVTKEQGGCNADWRGVSCVSNVIEAGVFSLQLQDYSSNVSLAVYDKLTSAGASILDGLDVDPNAQISNIVIIVNGGGGTGYIPPAPVRQSIVAGTLSPFTYTYTGDNQVNDYYLEQDFGGGHYVKSNMQIGRTGNVFTVTSSDQNDNGDFVFLDNYRLTIELA